MDIFSPAQLAKVVADTLPPDGSAKNRVVVGTVDQNGAQVVASFKWRDGKWQLRGAAHHDWNGDNTVGVGGSFTW
jgi:hypothetical protein